MKGVDMGNIKLDADIAASIPRNADQMRKNAIADIIDLCSVASKIVKYERAEDSARSALCEIVDKSAGDLESYENAKRKMDGENSRLMADVERGKQWVVGHGLAWDTGRGGRSWETDCVHLFTRMIDPFSNRILVSRKLGGSVPTPSDFPKVDAFNAEIMKEYEYATERLMHTVDIVCDACSVFVSAMNARTSAERSMEKLSKRVDEHSKNIKAEERRTLDAIELAQGTQRKRWADQDAEAAELERRSRELAALKSSRGE